MRGTKAQSRHNGETFSSRAERTRVRADKAHPASTLLAELQVALDSVDNALLLVDAHGLVTWANARFHQWMGIEPHQWQQGMPEADLAQRLAGQFRDPQRFLASSIARRGQQALWDELELLQPEHRLLERLSRPVYDTAGKLIGRLDVYRDITAGRLIHSKMVQTEKMAALGQLVSGIAHELNNPLTSIMGYAQLALAQEASRSSDSKTSNAARIFEEAQRAQRIVRNLLVFAREARAERAPLQLNEVVERTLALRSYELRVKSIAVHLDLQADLPWLRGDAHQLQQVVLNLLVNAEQAIESQAPRRSGGEARGHIGIRTERTAAGGVALEVCDDGPGVPAEVASRIFDPFFTTKPVGEGTGLGLSIAYGIVREHEGEITVSDAPREFAAASAAGVRWRTSFRVELPLGGAVMAEAQAQPLPPPPANRVTWRHAPRVLVVEDEQTVAQLICDVLREEGMRADVALGGREGLERLLAAEEAGAGRTYDLVICDLKMPGLDGPSLFHELLQRQHPARDRILFITGDTLSRRTLEFIERYKAPFLSKPFLAEELRAAVHRCLCTAPIAPAPHGREPRES